MQTGPTLNYRQLRSGLEGRICDNGRRGDNRTMEVCCGICVGRGDGTIGQSRLIPPGSLCVCFRLDAMGCDRKAMYVSVR